MPILAGIWNRDGHPVDRDQKESFFGAVQRWRPGPAAEFEDGEIAFLTVCPTNRERTSLVAPTLCSVTGQVVLFDGRLDNASELTRELGLVGSVLPDSIIRLGWQRWNNLLLQRLVGDWAATIWDSRERRLFLTCDFIGARRLYYMVQRRTNGGSWIRWCSGYTPLQLSCDEPQKVSHQYLLDFVIWQPKPENTPYEGIDGVPPGHWLEIAPTHQRLRKYRRLRKSNLLPCRIEQDYVDAFRQLFFQAVRRRVEGEPHAIADLSGGIDSSSIVCVAQHLQSRGLLHTHVHTLSYYDTSEPNGDERPYFNAVEQSVGRTGAHLNIADPIMKPPAHIPLPCPGYSDISISLQYFEDRLRRNTTSNVRLVGRGGDEVTGGIPDAVSQLAEQFLSLHWNAFLHLLVEWSVVKRQSAIRMALDSVAASLPDWFIVSRHKRDYDWLFSNSAVHERVQHRRAELLGAQTWYSGKVSVERAIDLLSFNTRPYDATLFGHQVEALPYLDQDLLEFLLFVPSDVLLRPRRRRALLRAALRGIVPEIVLERRTKWLGIVRPSREAIALTGNLPKCVAAGVCSSDGVAKALSAVRAGNTEVGFFLARLGLLEHWLSQCP